jgi:phage terminase large subunit GpA-like protein
MPKRRTTKALLAPSMREIANAIGDPTVERVTVLKSARVGFTTLLLGAIAHTTSSRTRARS